MKNEDGIDLDALQQSIEGDDDLEPASKEKEPTENDFDLKAALSGEFPPNLSQLIEDGALTEEQIITEAGSRGWTEEGKGDKYGHKISAIEFLERTPQFNTIKGLKDRLDRQEKQITKMADVTRKAAAKSIEKQQKLMTQLEVAKKELLNKEYLDQDDVNKVKTIDNQMDSVREDISTAETVTNDEDIWDEALLDFVADNPWYGGNSGLTEAAQVFAKQYTKNNKDSTPEDYYSNIKNKMLEKYGEQLMFPQEEKTQRRPNIGSNRNRQPLQPHKKEKSISDLPEDQRAIAREVMEDAGLSEAEYMKTYGIPVF